MLRKTEEGQSAVNVQPAEPQLGWIRLVKENFGFIRIEVSLGCTCGNVKLTFSYQKIKGRRWRHFLPLERGGRIRYAEKRRLGSEHDRVERPLWTMERHERKACLKFPDQSFVNLHSSSNFGNARKSHQSLEQTTVSRRCRARAKHCGRVNQRLGIRASGKDSAVPKLKTLPFIKHYLTYFMKLPIYFNFEKKYIRS